MTENSSCSFRDRTSILRLACIGFAVLVFLSLFLLRFAQDWGARSEANAKLYFLRHHFKDEVTDETRLIAGLLDYVTADRGLQEAWKARDRSLLMQRGYQQYRTFRERYGITHLYFIDLDRTCFLRVHNPSFHGDTIERLTLDAAMHTGKISSGLELGPLGTITHRVVRPWVIDGKVAGYIELGEDVERVLERIRHLLDVELILSIDKKNLDRKRWEEGMKTFSRSGDWNRYADVVVTSSTIKNITRDIEPLLTSDGSGYSFFTLKMNDRKYRGSYDQLVDIGGKPVGRYLLLTDITRRCGKNDLYFAASTLLLGGVAAFFLFLLRRRLRSPRSENGEEEGTPAG